jgi:hypothetical protein
VIVMVAEDGGPPMAGAAAAERSATTVPSGEGGDDVLCAAEVGEPAPVAEDSGKCGVASPLPAGAVEPPRVPRSVEAGERVDAAVPDPLAVPDSRASGGAGEAGSPSVPAGCAGSVEGMSVRIWVPSALVQAAITHAHTIASAASVVRTLRLTAER